MNNEQTLAVLDALDLARAKIHTPVRIRPEGVDGFCASDLVGFLRIVCNGEGYVGNMADGVTTVTPSQLAADWDMEVICNGHSYQIKADRAGLVCIYYRGATA